MKNRFTTENSVLLLIDHQIGTMKLVRNNSGDEVIQNTRALARTAKETNMPLVLTTSNETQFQGMLIEDLLQIAPEEYTNRIKRPGMVNAWDFEDFKIAALASGRKNIIMAGLTNDVCTVYPAISAVEEGFNVQVVVDAGGSPTLLADETALRRMENTGVVLTSTNQVMSELAYDWSTPAGGKILNIMYEEILAKLVTEVH